MRCLLVITAVLFGPIAGFTQTTWYVDCDNPNHGSGTPNDPFQKIQYGIQAAGKGDTVLVMPGVYKESVSFQSKSIKVVSDQGFDKTTITGTGNPTVEISGGAGPDQLLEGFTIRNGKGVKVWPQYLAFGGGILCMNSSPTIRNNRIIDNMSGEASYPQDYGGRGAGIYCYGSPVVEGNIIADNIVGYQQCAGGGIYIEKGSPIISNNIIANNASDEMAGGIFSNSLATPVIKNNTIVDNEASWATGVMVWNSSTIISNSLIWGNSPDQIWWLQLPDISYCDVQGGVQGVGNIDQDPLFDGLSYYRLSQLSPCINRGTNTGAPVVDVDGDPRPHMGTVDIGADEYTGTHLLAADGFVLDEDTGGTIQFTIDAGSNNGGRTYVLLASISGTNPGTPLPKGYSILPLNWDYYTNLVISNLNSAFYQNFAGVLSASGAGAATLWLGPAPGTAGLVMSHAYTLLGPFDFSSNPVNVEMVP